MMIIQTSRREIPHKRISGNRLLHRLAFLSVSLFFCLATIAQRSSPNVIFILADDLGWGDLSCYGNRRISTPNLDQLAAAGTLFTQFYQAAAVCSPSRAALMTGLFPATQRIHTAIGIHPDENAEKGCADFLDPKLPTITRILQGNGYATGHFGKWHLGATKHSPAPTEYGITTARTANSNSVDQLLVKGRANSSKMIIDETINFIEANRETPFYINAWLFDVHATLDPSQEQLATTKQLGITDKVPFHSPAQIYYAAVLDVDRQVGRLVEKLRELDLLDNTIIIFSSDNGPEDIEVINASHSGVGSAGMFRGRKRSLYEGGIRVPLIVRYSGKVPAGRIDNDNVISGIDFLATICALTGIKLPANLSTDGEDRSAAWLGNVQERTRDLFWEWRYGVAGHLLHKSPTLAIRQGKWMFLMNHDGTRRELYDIPADPMELTNLAEKNKTLVNKLSTQLLNWQKTLPAGYRASHVGVINYPWPSRHPEMTAVWDVESLQKAPAFSWTKEDSVVRSLVYESVDYDGLPTSVFAYYSNPDIIAGRPASGKKFPAVVLIHGGGGRAFPQWVEKWANMGYAAIAMDLAGKDGYGNNLPGGGPDQSVEDKVLGFNPGQVRKVWPYHAVASVILAHSLLLSFSEVQERQTFVTGISWGGYLTCIAAGLDSRFKAAAPVYGCGFLEQSDVFGKQLERLSSLSREVWIRHYDPARYIGQAKMPVLFMNGNKDLHYNVVPYHHTYSLVSPKLRYLCIKPDMKHNHRAGWENDEIGLFFDKIRLNRSSLPEIVSVKQDRSMLRIHYWSAYPLERAVLYYTDDDSSKNVDRAWTPVNTVIDADTKSITVHWPATWKYAFVQLVDGKGITTSTEFLFNQ